MLQVDMCIDIKTAVIHNSIDPQNNQIASSATHKWKIKHLIEKIVETYQSYLGHLIPHPHHIQLVLRIHLFRKRKFVCGNQDASTYANKRRTIKTQHLRREHRLPD